jgi:hypothetical protein
MFWERFSASEAAAGGVLAGFNASYFAREALRSRSRARRAAGSVLALLNLALAAEAALYLAFLPHVSGDAHGVALVAVRAGLTLALGAIALLVVRLVLAGRPR